MLTLRSWIADGTDTTCTCEPSVEGDRLVVDATSCDGDIAAAPSCRSTVVAALRGRAIDAIVVRDGGFEYAYRGRSVAILVAAARFADRIADRDDRLAARARRDPIRAARDATARPPPVADIAAECGLAIATEGVDYDAFAPAVGLRIGNVRFHPPPATARLVDRREPRRRTTTRIYRDGTGTRTYHVAPAETRLTAREATLLAAARDRLVGDPSDPLGVASGGTDDEDRDVAASLSGGAGGTAARVPTAAVRDAVEMRDGSGTGRQSNGRTSVNEATVARLGSVLRKHVRGAGVLTDLFADERVSDVYATAPVVENPLRVVADDEPMPTNVRLTASGATTLAARYRRESGRAFSRAAPTIDTATEAGGRSIRVAGTTDPISDGTAFAFRAHDRTPWTLPALVANGTLPAVAAAALSLAVERDAAILVAGARGAGKTTLLAALLWELAATTRAVVIEDTPELPVPALQSAGRDVQAIRVGDEDGPELPPREAVRTALRLGDGALVVGEVRGEEAGALYEAMRVGANRNAVLGTIHGDRSAAVRERVVSDLGVPESSFGATDLIVTTAAVGTAGDTTRRLAAIETVHSEDGVRFETAFDRTTDPPITEGHLHLLADGPLAGSLGRPDEDRDGFRDSIRDRAALIGRLADAGRTPPEQVTAAYASEGRT